MQTLNWDTAIDLHNLKSLHGANLTSKEEEPEEVTSEDPWDGLFCTRAPSMQYTVQYTLEHFPEVTEQDDECNTQPHTTLSVS